MAADGKDVNGAVNGTDSLEATTQALQSLSLEELGKKVFVGNLNFSTRQDQLREIFAKHGNVTDVQIILRGTRSLGYGFVTYASAQEAEAAVKASNKTEVDGRTINVEIARPPPPPRASKPESNGDKKSGDEDKENAQDTQSGQRGSRSRRGRGRGRGRGRTGRSRRPNEAPKSEASGAEDQGASTDASGPNDAPQSTKASPKRNRSKRGKGPGRGEGRVRRTGPPEGPLSTSLLFVGNLPFELTDEDLKEVFSAYPVTSAHVVRRRYGPPNGKSKGFGFVEFEDEQSQQKALAETQGKELDGRVIQVKVAVNHVTKGEASGENGSGGGESGDNTQTAAGATTAQ